MLHVGGFHHEVGHELRSSAEDENGGILLHMTPFSTRHFRRRTDQPQIAWLARARGNPGLLRRISLDTRFSLRLIRPLADSRV